MKRAIQTLEGDGAVYRGDQTLVSEAEYRLTVWQEFHDDGQGGEIPGVLSVTGTVNIPNRLAALLGGASLVLELEDHRRLPFSFESGRGMGAIVARGELK